MPVRKKITKDIAKYIYDSVGSGSEKQELVRINYGVQISRATAQGYSKANVERRKILREMNMAASEIRRAKEVEDARYRLYETIERIRNSHKSSQMRFYLKELRDIVPTAISIIDDAILDMTVIEEGEPVKVFTRDKGSNRVSFFGSADRWDALVRKRLLELYAT